MLGRRHSNRPSGVHRGHREDDIRYYHGTPPQATKSLAIVAQPSPSQLPLGEPLSITPLLRRRRVLFVSNAAQPLPYALALDSMKVTSKRGSRVRLSHAALWDLMIWRDLKTSPSSRFMHKPLPTLALYTDTSTSVGLEGALGREFRPGHPGT